MALKVVKNSSCNKVKNNGLGKLNTSSSSKGHLTLTELKE
jgi:hypothetical protein